MTEKTQHDVLLVITSLLFIIFATGLAVPGEIEAETVIVS